MMLRENRLQDCGLGPEGLHAIRGALQVNTMLTALDLSGNKFDDQSKASLCKLQWSTQIMHVNAHCMHIIHVPSNGGATAVMHVSRRTFVLCSWMEYSRSLYVS